MIPSTTPVAERDHQLEEPETAAAEHNASAVIDDGQASQIRPDSGRKEPDPATIDWFYRDPFGNEQGKFLVVSFNDAGAQS